MQQKERFWEQNGEGGNWNFEAKYGRSKHVQLSTTGDIAHSKEFDQAQPQFIFRANEISATAFYME